MSTFSIIVVIFSYIYLEEFHYFFFDPLITIPDYLRYENLYCILDFTIVALL